jgi:putative alpha-1,2-mannosidase
MIRTPRAAAQLPYITSLKVNEKPSTRTWLPESFVAHGGTLEFVLSGKPNKGWGSHEGDQPPSFEGNEARHIVPSPEGSVR